MVIENFFPRDGKKEWGCGMFGATEEKPLSFTTNKNTVALSRKWKNVTPVHLVDLCDLKPIPEPLKPMSVEDFTASNLKSEKKKFHYIDN